MSIGWNENAEYSIVVKCNKTELLTNV